MTSKERLIRTLEFRCPDRIPLDLWYLPGTVDKYGDDLRELLRKYPRDMQGVDYRDPLYDTRQHKNGTFTDAWGVTWLNLQDGIIGEAKEHPLGDWSALKHYRPPTDRLNEGWENVDESIRLNDDKFLTIPGGNLFERMQYLRGTENVLVDLMEDSSELYTLRDMVFDYNMKLVKRGVKYSGVDAVIFADDWGTQLSLLIPPRIWRSFFKPVYKALFDVVHDTGKYVFMHSDGYIMEIYDDLIEIGVNAINSQVWCMGVERVAEKCAGRLTFWGEISRQDTLPKGTPDDVRAAASLMKQHLYKNGGLIGQSEAGPDVPLANIEAVLTAWNAA